MSEKKLAARLKVVSKIAAAHREKLKKLRDERDRIARAAFISMGLEIIQFQGVHVFKIILNELKKEVARYDRRKKGNR